jgi:hypothetical protein
MLLIRQPAQGGDPQGVGNGAGSDQHRAARGRSAARPTSLAQTTPRPRALEPLTSDNYGGRYIYYGIREFGMAAAMNGMAQHGGVLPYGGTFLVFPITAAARSGSALCPAPR